MKRLILLIFLLPFISSFDSQTYIPCSGDKELVINCISGDSQNSFFGGISNGPIISLISPINNSEDSDTVVDFVYNASTSLSIKNCSLYLNSVLKESDNTVTKNIYQTFHIINMIEDDDLTWQIKCYDTSNNLGSSTVYFVDTQVGEGTGGGSIEGGGTNQTVNISKTICQEAYYFIVNRLDSKGNFNYTEMDLVNFADKITQKLSIIFYENDAIPYIENYAQMCFNLTSPIPKPVNETKYLSIFTQPENVCNNTINPSFLDSNIPIPDIYFNLNSCEDARLTKWFFSIGKDENGYFISGIRTWIVLSFLILIILIILVKYFHLKNNVNKLFTKIFRRGT
jgi:hypothetical protein